MPLYEYRNKETGKVIELRRDVSLRDDVGPELERITVPRRVCVFGTSSDRLDPHSADGQVPNGLKALTNNQVNDMVKESGFSVDKFKRTWGL